MTACPTLGWDGPHKLLSLVGLIMVVFFTLHAVAFVFMAVCAVLMLRRGNHE